MGSLKKNYMLAGETPRVSCLALYMHTDAQMLLGGNYGSVSPNSLVRKWKGILQIIKWVKEFDNL